MKPKTIRNKEDIRKIKQFFIDKNSFNFDRHLLYFTLGINTCLKPDELINLKWQNLINNNGIVNDYILFNGYRFYLNRNCKDIIYWYIKSYRYVLDSENVFNMTYYATNKLYRQIAKELDLNIEFSNLTLHKTFIYWQLYYEHRDYIKMSKLRLLVKEGKSNRNRDINTYSEYYIDDDMIYINNVNL